MKTVHSMNTNPQYMPDAQGRGAEGEGSAHPGGAAAHGGGQGRLCRGHRTQKPGHRPEEQGAHRWTLNRNSDFFFFPNSKCVLPFFCVGDFLLYSKISQMCTSSELRIRWDAYLIFLDPWKSWIRILVFGNKVIENVIYSKTIINLFSTQLLPQTRMLEIVWNLNCNQKLLFCRFLFYFWKDPCPSKCKVGLWSM